MLRRNRCCFRGREDIFVIQSILRPFANANNIVHESDIYLRFREIRSYFREIKSRIVEFPSRKRETQSQKEECYEREEEPVNKTPGSPFLIRRALFTAERMLLSFARHLHVRKCCSSEQEDDAHFRDNYAKEMRSAFALSRLRGINFVRNLFAVAKKSVHFRARNALGWSIDTKMTTELILKALYMAVQKRRQERLSVASTIVHSDRGSQYCSQKFQSRLTQLNMGPSMSRSGNCRDNAPCESIWSSLKREVLIGWKRFPGHEAAVAAVAHWIHVYNHVRPHSSIAMKTPLEYEEGLIKSKSVKPTV